MQVVQPNTCSKRVQWPQLAQGPVKFWVPLKEPAEYWWSQSTSQSLSIAESHLVLWHRRHVLFFPCSQKSQANPQLQTSCSLSALFLQGMQQRYVPILNLIVPQIKKGMIFVARGVWILAIPLPSEPHFWLLAKSVWGSTTALWKKCASTWEVSAQL